MEYLTNEKRIVELERQVAELESGNRNLNMIIEAQRSEITTLERIIEHHKKNNDRLVQALAS